MPSSSLAQSLAEVENLKRMRENMKKSVALTSSRSHTPQTVSNTSGIQGEEALGYSAVPTSTTGSALPTQSPPSGYDVPVSTSGASYHSSSLAEGFSTSELQPTASLAAGGDHGPGYYPPSSSYPSGGGGAQEVGIQEIRGAAGRAYAPATSTYDSDLANQVAAKLKLVASSSEYESSHVGTSLAGYSSATSSSYGGPSRSSLPGSTPYTAAEVYSRQQPLPQSYTAGATVSSRMTSGPMPQGVGSTEEKLRDEIQRLQRQLQEKDAKIMEQQHHINYGGGGGGSHHRHSGPIHRSYSGSIQVGGACV